MYASVSLPPPRYVPIVSAVSSSTRGCGLASVGPSGAVPVSAARAANVAAGVPPACRSAVPV